MRYRRLGNSGLKVSAVGLGGNNFGRVTDAQTSERIIHRALDLGVNFFDTADVYGRGVSEEHVGRALAQRRAEAVVATKVAMEMGSGPNETGASRKHIMDGVHASLRRLNMDHVDLLQIHRWDREAPIDETMSALDDLVHQGKVRYVGSSNFRAWQLVWALWASDRRGWVSMISEQPEYSLLNRSVERELMPACQAFGVGIIPYFPLAGGMLTGKYKEGEAFPPGTRLERMERSRNMFATPRNFAIVRKLEAWARDHGHPLTELAVAWLLARPMVSTVITGVTKPEQVEANVKAADWDLTPAEAEEVATLAPPE
jgi:aryl-alcohol dehydrogenase-like predicted oxidoreductase